MRVRARLALLYALLFLVAGAGLVALSYALVAARLPPAPRVLAPSGLPSACRQDYVPPQTLAKCKAAYAAGRRIGSRDQRSATLDTLLLAAGIGVGVATVLSAVLGWYLSGRTLAPWEAALASQRRFIAGAAHELRTPLTAMRTALEVSLAKPERTREQLEATAVRIKREVERAQAIVAALLTLAESELGREHTATVDLDGVVEEALADVEAGIGARELTLEQALEGGSVRGDPVLLARLVGNLVDNAVRHNVRGGWLSLRTARHGTTVRLEVANSGTVIAEERVASLFEPFTRLERTAGDGVGLGLSIAAAVASAHGAGIIARARPDGGLEMTVMLPAAAPDHGHSGAQSVPLATQAPPSG